MSRLKRLRSIDALINQLDHITKNQCSLSNADLELLTDAKLKLIKLKVKKGLTDKHYQQYVVEIVELITSFLKN